MIQVQREIEIDSPTNLVWQVITDFTTYPDWSGWKGTISGNAKAGTLLKVWARPRPGKVRLSFFRVIRVVENQELRWVASYVPLGLLRGERYWILKGLEGNRTRLIQGEAFMGLMVGVARKHLEKPGAEVFEKMCNGLKKYCEEIYQNQTVIIN